MLLKINPETADRIRAHGAEGYPHEICGALLGRENGDEREILAVFPLANQRDDSPRNRFSIATEDVLRAKAAEREQKLELVGWYHSHPDHPARPSEFDREHAWPWYSYVILSVVERDPREMTSWRLRDDRSAYEEEKVAIAARAAH
jgi:proteasome lid subunit RPN8/RPN11